MYIIHFLPFHFPHILDYLWGMSRTILNDLHHFECLNPALIVSQPVETVDCDAVVGEYHTLVRSTALFLQALEETQSEQRFTVESSVYNSLAYLQALWASRKPVSLLHLSRSASINCFSFLALRIEADEAIG